MTTTHLFHIRRAQKDEQMKKTALATLAVLAATWVVLPTLGFATADFAKKEGKPCKTCHAKPMKGDENLNDVGKCYKEKKDLAACTAK